MSKFSLSPRILSGILGTLLLLGGGETFAAKSPHVALDIVYDEQTRQVHIQAETVLSQSAPRFYLSKTSRIEPVDLAPGVVVTETYDAHVFNLKTGYHEIAVKFNYSLLLPNSHGSNSRTESSGRVDWSGNSTDAFLPGSRLWYPFFNQPSTVRLKITTAAGLRAIAPGLPIAYKEENGYAVSIFEMSKPILGIDLMIGHWLVRQKIMSGIKEDILLQTYFNQENAGIAEEYLDLCEHYIEFYEKLIGAYPYSSFTVVSSPFPTGLGMPSLTYISEKILKYPFIKSRSLPHEIVHNWWGNGVRVDYGLGNWSEGLTTYLADYWQTELINEDSAKEMRYGWLRSYASITDEDEESLQEFTTRYHTASSTIGYGKGAMFFHMLRNIMGNEPFVNCLKEFWGKYQHKSARFDNIRETCQDYTNTNLTEFFDVWIPTIGAPKFTVNLNRVTPTEHQLSINQNGKWIYPLDLEISSNNNIFKITDIVRAQNTTIMLPIDAIQSTEIKLDPDFNVWRQLYSTELVGTLRDFIVVKKPVYVQLTSNVQNGSNLVSTYFMENSIQRKYGSNFTNPEKNPAIILGDIASISALLSSSDNANDTERLLPLSQTKFIMASTHIKNAPTLLIGISKSITENDLSMLISRARHYGKYSWLKVTNNGKTKKGKWPIRDKTFSFSD